MAYPVDLLSVAETQSQAYVEQSFPLALFCDPDYKPLSNMSFQNSYL